jgi:hypothetical protein
LCQKIGVEGGRGHILRPALEAEVHEHPVQRVGHRAVDYKLFNSRAVGLGELGLKEAIGKFSASYADQAERDHAALKTAVKQGRLAVDLEN